VPTTPLALQRAIAAGDAVKLSVNAEGWYRVTQSALVAAGLSASADATTLQLFVDGVEQPLKVTAGRHFDAGSVIEFYGTGANTPYTDVRTYWLTAGLAPGRRIATASANKPRPPVAASFPFTVEHKDREVFFAALQNGEAENFFGELVTDTPIAITIPLTHLYSASTDQANLEVVLQGVTEGDAQDGHRVQVALNGANIGSVDFRGRTHVTRSFGVPVSQLVEGDNTVTVVASYGESDVSLVDVVRLTYPHTFTADAGSRRKECRPGP
jgi:hypothetical protein